MNEVKDIVKVINDYAHQLRENEWKHDMLPWQVGVAESCIRECFMRLKIKAINTHCKELINMINLILDKSDYINKYTGCTDIDVYNFKAGAILKAFELYVEGVIS